MDPQLEDLLLVVNSDEFQILILRDKIFYRVAFLDLSVVVSGIKNLSYVPKRNAIHPSSPNISTGKRFLKNIISFQEFSYYTCRVKEEEEWIQ